MRAAVAATVVAIGLIASATSGVAAQPAAHHHGPPAPRSVQEYYWSWSDTPKFTARTFIHSDYADQASLPKLVITVVPPNPRRVVYLEFYQDGAWSAENIVRTNARGIALVDLDPYCSNDSWCDGTYTYRLRMGSLTAPVSVSYFEH